MDKNGAFETICNLRSKHGISLGEIKDIQQKERETISSIENIFDMSNQTDVDLLVALIYLLNDEPDDIYDWFIENHKNCEYFNDSKKANSFGNTIASSLLDTGFAAFLTIPSPKDNNNSVTPGDDYLFKILIAAFMKNPLFFSMAWNWNIFNLNSISDSRSEPRPQNNIIRLFKTDSDLFHPQSLEVDYSIYASAAGSSGFNNLTQMPINFPFLGELEVRGNSETERLVFVLFIAPECREMKFKLNIYYEIDNKEYTATIIKESNESTDEIRSRPIRIDFSKGIHIKKVEWNPL
jgi:hypothetical protein